MTSVASSVITASTLATTSNGIPTATPITYGYSYATSTIVRVAVAAGIIILVLTALVLFFKISSWIRFRQRLRRQHALMSILDSEQEAKAFEIAAWADEPGQAPVRGGANRPAGANGSSGAGKYWWGGRNSRKKGNNSKVKNQKRGRTNAHAVHEWEGVPA